MKPGDDIKAAMGDINYRFFNMLPYYGDAGQGWTFKPWHNNLTGQVRDSGSQHIISIPENPVKVLPNGDLLGVWINNSGKKRGIEMDERFGGVPHPYLTWVDKGNAVMMVYKKNLGDSDKQWYALSQTNLHSNLNTLFFGLKTNETTTGKTFEESTVTDDSSQSLIDKLPGWLKIVGIVTGIGLVAGGIYLATRK